MADLNVQRETPRADLPPTENFEDDYAWWEVIYWIVGIIMIPLVPILMITFFTPWSGIGR